MKRFVRDLKEKDHFQTVFLVRDKGLSSDRNGKPILSLTLADATGQLNARMFERVQDVSPSFDIGDVVWTKGFVQLFQNRKQMVINDIRKAQDSEYSMPDLVADLGGDPRVHLAELLKTVQEMKNPFIRQLIEATLRDPALEHLILRSPAAKTIHHAYRGGLIEHVRSIVQIMISLKTHYAFLDLDLLIFGAIYHDLGKVFELDVKDGIQYTRSGRLVGHMAIACQMIQERAQAIEGFPEDLLDVLKHIVLSHHGKLEYGSPKLPMLPEALVVAMVDDMDSKMNTLFHFMKTEVENSTGQESWTHYHPGFERYFFLDFFRNQIKDL